jgi:HAD superfamily hydrolase (TIGR01549 family)
MKKLKIISFDVEGTLVTTDFSYAIWFEAIPELYAEKHGITLDNAKKAVEEEYKKVGDQKPEWYDIKYWFRKLGLGNYQMAMERYNNRIYYYPEVIETLSSLNKRYRLIASSGSAREFLDHLLRDIEPHFHRVFSSISDYKQTKTSYFYREVCKTLVVNPEQILHIGDNWQFDCVAASEIGIHTLFLDRDGETNKRNSLTTLSQLTAFLDAK